MEDIVPVTLYVSRYIIKQSYCKKCGKIVHPEVHEVIDNCHFGLHFLLCITYLRYVMNLPDNKIATLLNDIYDDTGQRMNGMNRWLWIFISNEVMLYYTSKSRSKKVVVEILGDNY